MPATQFIIKTLVSAFLIALISTLGKKLPLLGAILASLPLTSILAMIWLYQDTRSVDAVARLSSSIFWMVVPSLVFFMVLPPFLKSIPNFYAAITAASAVMAITYPIFVWILKTLKIEI